MVFDPEQHEKHQRLYLAALLRVVEDHETQNPDGSAAIVGLCEAETAKATGLSRSSVERISEELSDSGYVECMGGSGPEKGRSYVLTNDGRAAAEGHRYDKSFLAKRRKATAWAGESAKSLSKSVWSNVLTGGGGLVAGYLLRHFQPDMLRWLAALFGR